MYRLSNARIQQARQYLERKLFTALLLREHRHTKQRLGARRMLELHRHALTLAETILPSYLAQWANGNRWLEEQIKAGDILASVPLPEPKNSEGTTVHQTSSS